MSPDTGSKVKQGRVDYRVAIKDMPEDLRPRERLLKEGPQHLSDIELLAILLRTGSADASAMDLAAGLLGHFGGLKQLLGCYNRGIKRVQGHRTGQSGPD